MAYLNRQIAFRAMQMVRLPEVARLRPTRSSHSASAGPASEAAMNVKVTLVPSMARDASGTGALRLMALDGDTPE